VKPGLLFLWTRQAARLKEAVGSGLWPLIGERLEVPAGGSVSEDVTRFDRRRNEDWRSAFYE
jgi:hypothetical protein